MAQAVEPQAFQEGIGKESEIVQNTLFNFSINRKEVPSFVSPMLNILLDILSLTCNAWFSFSSGALQFLRM